MGLYILIDVYVVREWLAFMIIYGIAYLFLYFIQRKFIFQSKHSIRIFVKFIASLICFYIIANVLFNLLIYFEIVYGLATIFTIITLFPIRFFVSNKIVFK
ncbi:MAG: hypothetical protein CL818_11010 [Croceibacter sp.]|nr:hypothetical protein [Croceibacter sp.]